MKQLLTTATFCLCFLLGQAQEYIDLFNVYYWQAPATNYKDFDGTMQLDNFTVNGRAPIVLDSANVLLFGAEFSRLSMTSEFDIFKTTTSFNAINLQVGFQKKWNKKVETLFMVIPRLNSDFETVNKDHFQLGGIVLNTLRKNEDFAWKLGAYYNTEFFGNFLIPILGWDWKINDQWRFKMLLPVNATLRYQPKRNWAAGIAFDGVNGSCRISDNANSYIEKLENYAGLFTDIYLTKKLVLNLKARYSFLRYYRAYAGDEQVRLKMGPISFGDDRVKPLTDFEDGLAFEARLIFRFPIDEQ